jgi:tetratricopeptide (TPR) repeat protein
MATNPASVAPIPPAQAQPLWQAPLFVLGVAALAAAWFGRPYLSPHAARRLDRDLAEARQLLARPDGDADAALELAERVLDQSESRPEQAGAAGFLAGCACIRLAEQADPARARELWGRAGSYLEQAQAFGVPEADKPALAYRLAKIEYHTSADLPAVIVQLEEAVPNCDRRAEGYALLTQAYLKLPKPDLPKALEANAKLRDVAEATEAELAAAKLLGGELLLRMGKPEEARKSLDLIGPHSPPGILVKARLLQARSFQEEKRFNEAVALYIDLLAKHKSSVGDPAQIHYNLGLCYRQLDQPREAAKELQECVTLSRGPEGQAAALMLAETRLAEPALEGALDALTLALARVDRPEEWKNPLAPLARAGEVFEKALAAFRQASRHDLALKLLDVYAKLVPQPRVMTYRAEVAAEWARLKGEVVDSPEAQLLAKQLYKVAAEANDKLAELSGVPLTQQGEYKWASAQHYLAAGEKASALARLEQVVTLNLEPARLGEAWYRLAELYRALEKEASALAAYRKCLEYDTRFSYLARYQLAMAALEKNPDEAEAALILNIKLLRWDPDSEALRPSLFALCNMLYQKRLYNRVYPYLEDALGRFKEGKDSPEVTNARFQLANSYRQKASQDNLNQFMNMSMSEEAAAHFKKEHLRWLQKAAEEFSALERFLETPEGKDHLTPELRAQVPVITAKCWADLGEYGKALAIYEKLIERSAGKAQEQLDALGGAVACHGHLGQLEKVKQRLLQIRKLLDEGQLPEDVRKPWEEWHRQALLLLKDEEKT